MPPQYWHSALPLLLLLLKAFVCADLLGPL
jgi:hypothetical protein